MAKKNKSKKKKHNSIKVNVINNNIKKEEIIKKEKFSFLKNITINSSLLFYLSILYLEIIFKLFAFNELFNKSLIYIIIMTIPYALLFNLLSSIFNKKLNKILIIIYQVIIFLIYATHFIFYKLFSTILSFSSLNMANQAADNAPVAFQAIKQNIFGFILLLIPLVITILVLKRISTEKYSLRKSITNLVILVIMFFLSVLTLFINKSDMYSPYNLYFKINEANISSRKIGLLTTTRLDIKRYLFGFKSELLVSSDEVIKENEDNKDKKIEYNTTNIDFDSLIQNESNKTLKNMHTYFSNEEITSKNDYTGMFKGKNLIFILAEGWNEIAVSKELTPTMYKLVNEGFNFDNFYSPVFLSTTGGEFQSLVGAIPNQSILGTWKKGNTYLPYSIGNIFAKEGYTAKAFHDWTYSYYDRQKTMPTLGFSDYLACRNGLEKRMKCNLWPTSDYEMFDVTTADFLTDSTNPFVTYYITVSGHASYNFTGNNMAARNKSVVEPLSYSNSVKAYLASQYELEKGLTLLLQRLEEANELDDTVIVMVGDHYPYTLSTGEINEISTYDRDLLFEVNHSDLIIWNNGMKKIEIDKVGGSIDILPTLLNLFGIEYDSRLLLGKDLLSNDTEGLVMFNDRSWISDSGKYTSSTGNFISFNDSIENDEYIKKTVNKVYNKFTMSQLLIDNNYYEKLGINK